MTSLVLKVKFIDGRNKIIDLLDEYMIMKDIIGSLLMRCSMCGDVSCGEDKKDKS